MTNKLKYFYPKRLKELVYVIRKSDYIQLEDVKYKVVKSTISNKKIKYEVFDKKILVHESTVYKKLHFLKLINKTGPAIGDCFTNNEYRGQSIYPSMLSLIVKELLFEKNNEEVCIIVDHDNIGSIKGIEKAGFKLHSKIETCRFLFIYYNTKFIN
ncbi:hypothetical protein [Flavobacterium sp.]|uniref:hypothetical protein n=1 Tax=Flavobacterium sp. TaxID=239 RepID=UPI00375005E9